MKKSLLKTICITLVVALCTMSINAQNIQVKAPNPGTENLITGNEDAIPFLQKGAASPLFFSTTGTGAGVFASTLGTFNTAAQQLATISLSYQSMVEVNDVLYVVTYNSTSGANTFGKVDKTTGQFTQIKSTTADAISMAYNPVDGNVYYTIWGTNTSSQFGTIDVLTGNYTAKGSVPGLFYIAIDNDGICYGVGTSGVFGKVSLTNGAFSQTSTYDDLNFIQDMAVDFETNDLYHYRRWGTQTAPGTPSLRKIDKATGAVTELGQFHSSRTVESFVIVGGGEIPCDPVTGFTVAYTEDCKATLTWSGPASVTYNIKRDGNPIQSEYTGTSYTDETFDTQVGHTWEVIVNCETLTSDPVSESLPACYTPPPCDPVTEGSVTYGGYGEDGCAWAIITWTPVEGAVSYKISFDGIVSTSTETTISEEREFLYGENYTWEIITVCEDNESAPFTVSETPNGIKEVSNSFAIHPNPAKEMITLTGVKNINTIEVLNFLGQVVISQFNTNTVDVSQLTNGVYFVRMTSDSGISVKKFVKQ